MKLSKFSEQDDVTCSQERSILQQRHELKLQ